MQQKKILILEDEKSLAKALELKLKKAGFDVKTALNGEEGLMALECEGVDFIICDLMMPVMDGFTFLKKIREKEITTHVMVLTNLSQQEDQKRINEYKPVDFFVKSDTPINKIVEHVSSILKQ